MSETRTSGVGNVFVSFREDPLRREVRGLLGLLAQSDPSGGEERNDEWPLQIRGDDAAMAELCERLNRLEEMTR
jgi:hypothetical protein